jgi:hypothetical protein
MLLIAPQAINTPARVEFRALNVTLNPPHNIRRSHRPRLARYFAAIDEECQCGDAANVESCTQVGHGFGVYFDDADIGL